MSVMETRTSAALDAPATLNVKVVPAPHPAGLAPRPIREEVHGGTGLSAAAVMMLSAPVAVSATAAAGCLVVGLAGVGLFLPEMFASAMIALAGGLLAALPMTLATRTGVAEKMVQAAMAGIGIRMVLVLGGTLLALGPAWGLSMTPLAYWTLGFYFPMLAAETGVAAWAFGRLDRR